MKAGDLTIDYIGSNVTLHDVGLQKRTVTFKLGSVNHERVPPDTYRTVVASMDRNQTVILKPGAEVEIS